MSHAQNNLDGTDANEKATIGLATFWIERIIEQMQAQLEISFRSTPSLADQERILSGAYYSAGQEAIPAECREEVLLELGRMQQAARKALAEQKARESAEEGAADDSPTGDAGAGGNTSADNTGTSTEEPWILLFRRPGKI